MSKNADEPSLREALEGFLVNIDNALAVPSGKSDMWAKGFDEATTWTKQKLTEILASHD